MSINILHLVCDILLNCKWAFLIIINYSSNNFFSCEIFYLVAWRWIMCRFFIRILFSFSLNYLLFTFFYITHQIIYSLDYKNFINFIKFYLKFDLLEEIFVAVLLSANHQQLSKKFHSINLLSLRRQCNFSYKKRG